MSYKKIDFHSKYYKLAPYRFANSINRHFYLHGVTYRPMKSLELTASETAIEAFENSGINFTYLNPLSIYYANQMNDYKESNINISFSAKWKKKNYSIWFELLIDDFQIESSDTNILNKEPAEFGIILGGFYKLNNNYFYLNYAEIRNRTYNDPYDNNSHNTSYTKFIDRNHVIGYMFGNNLRRLNIRYLSSNLMNNINLTMDYSYLNRGDEAIFSRFDRSYLTEDNESFTFGELSSTHNIGFSATYHKNNFRFLVKTNYISSDNNNQFSLLTGINYKMEIY